ncbi:fimbrial protein [Vagococcus sp. WN89Y]|uniref:fimbrial protein n=1 Tax=Vagococcus sp. WN89Y TaxID=3457258 RepID=UPI003FCC814D
MYKNPGMLIIIIFACLVTSGVYAKCNQVRNFTTTEFSLPSEIVVKGDLSVGSLIYPSQRVNMYSGPAVVIINDCTGSGMYGGFETTYAYTPFSANLINNNIIQTNIPGIGLKTIITLKSYAESMNNLPTPASSIKQSYGYWHYSGDVFVDVQLIKTSDPVGAGELNAGEFMRVGWKSTDDQFWLDRIVSRGVVKIVNATCNIIGNADKVISFGTVVNKNLSSLTGTIPDTDRYINIELKCTPGTKVGITYDSTDKHSYLQSSVINRGTAKDVLVLFQDGIGKLGQQNTVIQSSGETEVIKQRVSLYAYGSPTPGSISAQATYTLNYE